MPEKAKLKAVCETAVAAVQQAYPEPEQLDDVPPFDGGTETAVELLVRNQAVDNTISVEDVRTRMEEQYPLAVPAFEQALADSGVERNDRVTVSPSRIKSWKAAALRPNPVLRSRSRGTVQQRRCSGVHPQRNGRAFAADQGRFGVKLANILPFGGRPV